MGGVCGGGHVWWGGMCGGGMHGRGGMHAGGHAWRGVWVVGTMCGRGHVWWGSCMAGGMCGRGVCMAGGVHGRGHVWQEKRPLQWAVCVLLECIFVLAMNFLSTMEIQLHLENPDRSYFMEKGLECNPNDLEFSLNASEIR